MAAPRKIFRIEQTAAARMARRPAAAVVTPLPLRSHAPHDTAPDIARIAEELDAIVAGTAQATQKILAAAEEIDQLAGNLAAALKGRIENDAAQDISELVIRIFEACNFQDLTGQRIANVLDALKPADEDLADEATLYLHGPRRDAEDGHMSQAEIDELFGG